MSNVDDADVVIVGGGIVGCATAYYLAKRGVRVVVLERGAIASEQSSRAWGFVRQQGRHEAEIAYAAMATRMWQGLAGELQADVEFVQNGILVPCETEADEQRFATSGKIGASHGLSTRMLTSEEIGRLVPELRGKWRAGLYTAEDGHAEPRKATEAFAAAAARRGAVLLPNSPVIDIETRNGAAFAVRLADRVVRAPKILIASGIGTPHLLRLLNVTAPIQPIRSSVAETNPTMPFSRVAIWGPHAAFRPTLRGTIYVGNGYRSRGAIYDVTPFSLGALRYFLPTYKKNYSQTRMRLGREFLSHFLRSGNSRLFAPLPEPRIDARRLGQLERRLYEHFPHLADLGIARMWAGRIDMTPDLIPIIGPVDRAQSIFVAAGFSGHGFALGPATGSLLSEWIADGKPSLDLRPFRPSRFAEGDINLAPDAL